MGHVAGRVDLFSLNSNGGVMVGLEGCMKNLLEKNGFAAGRSRSASVSAGKVRGHRRRPPWRVQDI